MLVGTSPGPFLYAEKTLVVILILPLIG
jgi:hypothetical protein